MIITYCVRCDKTVTDIKEHDRTVHSFDIKNLGKVRIDAAIEDIIKLINDEIEKSLK